MELWPSCGIILLQLWHTSLRWGIWRSASRLFGPCGLWLLASAHRAMVFSARAVWEGFCESSFAEAPRPKRFPMPIGSHLIISVAVDIPGPAFFWMLYSCVAFGPERGGAISNPHLGLLAPLLPGACL